MPKIKFLPHKKLLPHGGSFFGKEGESILDVALRNKIKIEHACEKSCSCSTCHCIIKKGFTTLSQITEKEEDVLDKAWNLTENSRLSCQAKLGKSNIEVKIPKYTTNYN
ncbi:ISC system 2Fe-2S type ferredoxin [Buchnera aphidicola]|uniref:ISC system 2Fe-2S type ferredoxin n=1 Tax=Buchnera aphidicola TaxID=9 RepID=UPI0022374B1D|nr:ISC system 2Fe-2S type ferredoxin [Buchnera aphidicola]MCW5197425.1 ISC system 2Fe-2S type ferredoxin [Buchnera aphidicola (Chaitophorus viminalis)]